jgi:hypothetical protein
VDWDSVVSIAIWYGMKCPVSVMARLSKPIQTGPGAHPASYIIGTGLFPWVKQPGRGVNHPPLSSTKVKEGIALYLYSPLCLHDRVNFTFTFLPCRKLCDVYKNESVDGVWGRNFGYCENCSKAIQMYFVCAKQSFLCHNRWYCALKNLYFSGSHETQMSCLVRNYPVETLVH